MGQSVVKIREFDESKSIPIKSEDNQLVRDEVLSKWQNLLNLISEVFDVPSALIMRLHETEIEVFALNEHKNNPYESLEKCNLGMGLYCETVLGTDQALEVPNALQSSIWRDNPDVKLNMISYLGYPIKWPDGSYFGTICVLDNKTRIYSEMYKKMLEEFGSVLETDLDLYIKNHELKRSIDILEKTQEQLIKLERNKITTELMSGIAHEINTPIGVSITTASHINKIAERGGQLTSAKEYNKTLEDIQEGMALLNRNLEAAAGLISSYKRISTDQSKGDCKVFSVGEYIESVFRSMRYELKLNHVTYQINAEDSFKIFSCPGPLTQVFMNLITNSMIHGFNGVGGHINVHVEETPDVCLITFEDNGSGILPKNYTNVFEPFFTENKEGYNNSVGLNENSGMGLSIAKEIVEKTLKGSIKCVTSNSGAKFLIELPKAVIL